MLDLTAAPFHLDAEGVAWTTTTLASLSTEQKIGQLFCMLAYDSSPETLDDFSENRQVGGLMLRPMPPAERAEVITRLQTRSKVPFLIAGNLEAGSKPTVSEGTFTGNNMMLGATGSADLTRRAGHVIGKESRAAGVNWAFAPVIDLDINWRNPITGTRTFGSDTDLVAALGSAWIEAVEAEGVATSAKHFPGDGVDERDQHLVASVNTMTPDEWDATYGEVYRAAIAAGTKTIMAGHIMLPEYSEALRPGLADEDCLPGSLAPELLGDLLREKLGFNGLIVSDATSMIGMTTSMPRAQAVPQAIAAGCDMFLFTKNLDEDFAYMRAGVADGRISADRLDEAVTRVLALKASLGLHTSDNLPVEDAATVIGAQAHQDLADEVADRAVTLVKEEPGVLPLTPERYRRVLVYRLELDVPGYQQAQRSNALDVFIDKLTAEGHEVTTWVQEKEGFEGFLVSAEEMKRDYDLIVYAANLPVKSNQTVVRIEWALPMGVNGPAFITEIPTVFVSLANPYHLVDVPRIRTVVNAYASEEHVIDAVIEKLAGRSKFTGVSPVDAFCGRWDTRL